jgi:hypothetical protein
MMLDPLTITVLLTVMSQMPILMERAPALARAADAFQLRSQRTRTIVLQRAR